MITFGSLFSGIGGMDLGLERAGMECAWQVEIDEFCLKVLDKHWPDVPKYKDVRDVGKHNLESVDLIAGGFPCQPHSVAGKRKGAADDRNLWPEFIRIIRDLKPRYVLGENVPGIVTTYIDTVLSDLEGEGYSCTTFNLPACGFDAPHRRERIFIVAFREDKGINRGKRLPRDVKNKSKKGRTIRRGSKSDGGDKTMADTNGTWSSQSQRSEQKKRRRSFNSGQDVAHSERERLQTSRSRGSRRISNSGQENNSQPPQSSSNRTTSNWWVAEPNVGRVAHGIPNRIHRLRGLGNAVVPQVAEWIGRRIIENDPLKHREKEER